MSINLTDEQKEILGIKDERVDFYFRVENSVIDGYEIEEINPKTGKVEIVEKSYFDNIYELAVYTTLSRYCNNGKVAFPSISTLAKKCCCGQTSVKNAIKGLEQKGFIKKLNRKKVNSLENDTNIYAIKNIEEIFKVGRVATDVGRVATDVGRVATSKNNNINNNNINKTCMYDMSFEKIEKEDFGINPKGFPRKDKWEKFLNENLSGIDYVPNIELAIKLFENNLIKKGALNPEKEVKKFLVDNYNNGIQQNLSFNVIANSIITGKRIEQVKVNTIEIENNDNVKTEIIAPVTRIEKIKFMKNILSENELSQYREKVSKELLENYNISEKSVIESELDNYLILLYNKKYKNEVA